MESVVEDLHTQSPQYEEKLVVTHAVTNLNIDWPAEKQAELQKSKLDEHFMQARPPPPCFFPNLHTEVPRSWARPFSAGLFIPVSDYYGNVAGLNERGYRAMPRVEQTLTCYLSPGAALYLKALALPSKLLRTTSVLVRLWCACTPWRC